MSFHQQNRETEVADALSDARYSNIFAKLLLEQTDNPVIWKKAFPNGKIPDWIIDPAEEFKMAETWIYRFFKYTEPAGRFLWMENAFLAQEDPWLEDLWIKWRTGIASVFFITGNINDYGFNRLKGYMPIAHLISEEFLNRVQGCHQVIRYSLSRSFEFVYREDLAADVKSNIEQEINLHNSVAPQNQHTWDKLISDFQVLDKLLSKFPNLILIIENAGLIFSADSGNIIQNLLADYLLHWSFSTDLAFKNNGIILLSEAAEDITRHLVSQSNKVEFIHIPRPQESSERLKFLLYIHSLSKLPDFKRTANTRAKSLAIPPVSGNTRLGYLPTLEEDLKSLSKLTSGLNYIGIEDLLLQIQATGSNTETTINKIKGNILQTESAGLLELVQSKKDLDHDICGYDEIKQQLNAISRILKTPSSTALQQRTVPMGILFVGPPGTGKTVVAEAFSNKCGMNFLKLGDFRSKWVGESERNLSKVLDLIRAYTPVIVFMDELDQTEGSRGTNGNNDVDKRLFSKLLQFMSDTKNRGKVLWIAASNRPDLIDAALKRPGRFDLKIPFLPQGPSDRRKTFERYLTDEDNTLTTRISDSEWDEIIEATHGFTGAEIEEIVNGTIRKKMIMAPPGNSQPHICLAGEDLKFACTRFKPGINTKDFNDMIEASLTDVTSEEFIPESWHNWKNPFKYGRPQP